MRELLVAENRQQYRNDESINRHFDRLNVQGPGPSPMVELVET